LLGLAPGEVYRQFVSPRTAVVSYPHAFTLTQIFWWHKSSKI